MMLPNAHQMRIEFDQRVPMRDSVTLSADVYFPVTSSMTTEKWPIILFRTPYIKADIRVYEVAKYYTEHGYIFVAIDVRGRGDSDGTFTPYINEGLDGYDTIEWLASQSWSDGTIGTIGSSYPGCIQWLAALHQP